MRRVSRANRFSAVCTHTSKRPNFKIHGRSVIFEWEITCSGDQLVRQAQGEGQRQVIRLDTEGGSAKGWSIPRARMGVKGQKMRRGQKATARKFLYRTMLFAALLSLAGIYSALSPGAKASQYEAEGRRELQATGNETGIFVQEAGGCLVGPTGISLETDRECECRTNILTWGVDESDAGAMVLYITVMIWIFLGIAGAPGRARARGSAAPRPCAAVLAGGDCICCPWRACAVCNRSCRAALRCCCCRRTCTPHATARTPPPMLSVLNQLAPTPCSRVRRLLLRQPGGDLRAA